jgi:hypothetical protein
LGILDTAVNKELGLEKGDGGFFGQFGSKRRTRFDFPVFGQRIEGD